MVDVEFLEYRDDLVEVEIGAGKEVVPLGEGRAENRITSVFRLRGQYFPYDRFGLALTASINGQEDSPIGWGVGLGTIFRLE